LLLSRELVMTRARLWSVITALIGICLFTVTMAWFGWAGVVRALSAVRASDFVAYLVVQAVIVAGLAVAWRLVLRSRRGGRFFLLYWGRLVRDAAGEFLPFSHVGGFILGGRAISLGGVAFADAAASTLADVTVEFLSELVFISVGLVLLATLVPDNQLIMPVALGLMVALLGGVGFLFAQKGGSRIFRALALRIAGHSGDQVAMRADHLQAALDAIYARPGRLAGAGAMHLLCWFGTGCASFVAFRAFGTPISIWQAVAIEALLHAILAAGFFVPGRIGVQEAAYALLGTAFGLPPDIALSVSLLRRARDLIVAVPVLLIWQGIEARRLQPLSGEAR
jgi:putative membrane protein